MTMIVKIMFGIAGLGVIVFIHEMGHFIAAKLMGIEVETFSIGWGKKLFSFKKKETEYCISLFPLGGYCKMKGDEAMKDAWENGSQDISAAKGSFYGASPWRRIVVAVAGPGMNFVFAICAFSLVWFIGFSYNTFSNRIILESDYAPSTAGRVFPAAQGGLKTGDYITAVDSDPVLTYRDLQDAVALKPEKNLKIEYTRDGIKNTANVTPLLDKETGAGKIGVYAWVEPIIGAVARDSAAYIAGLAEGDRILSVNGRDIPHTRLFYAILQESPAQTLSLVCDRNGQIFQTRYVPRVTAEGRQDIGFSFKSMEYSSRETGILGSLREGVSETFETLTMTVKSLGLLFRGIDLSQAVSGPLRITYFVGEVAAQGFSRNFKAGVTSILNFLSLLSVALFFMNLLPIPALDGGLILLFLIEGLRGRALAPRFIYRYQFIGIFFILLLIILSTMSDVFYFFRK
ncbi:MAG: site-2 protease family protein [Spirochaetales bacterium]|jgi:regulator of sigma E protease|nr:site-2 protease family protein [Spirochaetales bacterium]